MQDSPRFRLVIGNKNYSSWSLRAWLTLVTFDIPFRETVIDMAEDTSRELRLAHAPSGRVPILHDGDLTIWDSLAICEYVAEQFPDRALWPRETVARAIARSLCAEMHSGFAALRQALPMNCRARRERRARDREVETDIARIQDAWRRTRREFGRRHAEDAGFLFGPFSIADAFFAPVACRFFTYDVPLASECEDYVHALFALPGSMRWMAEAEAEKGAIAQTDAVE